MNKNYQLNTKKDIVKGTVKNYFKYNLEYIKKTKKSYIQ